MAIPGYDWENMTPLGRQLAEQAMGAQGSPAMMGIPQSMMSGIPGQANWFDPSNYLASNPDLAGMNPADAWSHWYNYGQNEGRAAGMPPASYQAGAQPSAPSPYGGNYSYDFGQIQSALDGRNAGQTDASLSAIGDNATLAGNWIPFQDKNGQLMDAWANGGQMTGYEGEGADRTYSYGPNTGYRVFKAPGDLGGTGFKGQSLSKLNGIAYDDVDANGNYLGKGVFNGYSDESVGDALGVGSILTMAAGAAAGGLGAAGAAGGGGGAVGGSGAFLGEGALSGVGAWDSALAAAPSWSAAGGLAGGAAGSISPGNGAFLGENVASGVPAWDAAAANAGLPLTSAPGAASDLFPGEAPWSPTPNAQPLDFGAPPNVPGTPNTATSGAGAANPTGVPPPANPNLAGAGSSLIPGVSNGSLLGTGATILGGALGSQSGTGSGSGGGAGGVLDARMEPYLYGSGGLLQKTQDQLNSQSGQAAFAGQQIAGKGMNLLGAPIAGNGYGTVGTGGATNGYGYVGGPVAGNGFDSGAVKLNAPTTVTNPYASGVLDDLQRRQGDMTSKQLMGIQGNAVGTGGLGGSRQGVAQAGAIAQGADNFTGQAANFMGGLYNADQNRALQQYQADQGFYASQRGQDLSKYGQDQNFYTAQRGQDLQTNAQNQAFYGQQRGQDLTQADTGLNLVNQGLQMPWTPITNASNVYKPYTGLASSSGGDSGFNWQGLLGGALAGAQLGKNAGWWG